MMASPKEDPTSEDYLDELLNVKQAASGNIILILYFDENVNKIQFL